MRILIPILAIVSFLSLLVLAFFTSYSLPALQHSGGQHLLTPGKDFKVHVGNQEWVFTETQEESFGLRLYSDMPVPVFRKDGRYYWWITAFRNDLEETETLWVYRFSGPDLFSMRPDPASGNGQSIPVLKNELGSFDNGYVGISAIYWDENQKKLYAWYHAEDRDFPSATIKASKKKAAGYAEAPYYATIGAAVSRDNGRTFTKLGKVLTAGKTKEDVNREVLRNPQNYTSVDIGSPSVIKIYDTYLYIYYFDITSDGASGVGVARLPVRDLDKRPQPWKKYYNGAFTEPGIGGRFDILVDSVFGSVVYNRYLNQFLVVHAGPDEQNIFMRASHDGLKWSSPLRLVSARPPTWNVYPTLIGDGEEPNILGDRGSVPIPVEKLKAYSPEKP